jgi:hypothetical protein
VQANLVFERRGADGKLDRLPQLAQELVESKIDVTAMKGLVSDGGAKALSKPMR